MCLVEDTSASHDALDKKLLPPPSTFSKYDKKKEKKEKISCSIAAFLIEYGSERESEGETTRISQLNIRGNLTPHRFPPHI